MSLKGTSRGPEALRSHLNDFYHTSVFAIANHLRWSSRVCFLNCDICMESDLRGQGGVLYTTGISHSDP